MTADATQARAVTTTNAAPTLPVDPTYDDIHIDDARLDWYTPTSDVQSSIGDYRIQIENRGYGEWWWTISNAATGKWEALQRSARSRIGAIEAAEKWLEENTEIFNEL